MKMHPGVGRGRGLQEGRGGRRRPWGRLPRASDVTSVNEGQTGAERPAGPCSPLPQYPAQLALGTALPCRPGQVLPPGASALTRKGHSFNAAPEGHCSAVLAHPSQTGQQALPGYLCGPQVTPLASVA